MKTVLSFFAVLGLVAGLFGFHAPAFAGAYDELTADQQALIQKGEVVFVAKDVDGSPWPKAFVYLRIDSTPEEAAAVFSDYGFQKSYIPNILKSEISKRISKTSVYVDYTIHIPILSDESYTVQDTLSAYDGGASYRVDWTLIRADSTKSTVGNARFEQLGTGTLMAYYNFVVPGSSMAGLVKKQAMKQVQDVTKAIRAQTQKERTGSRELLDKQIKVLRDTLAR
ncbi:hypothetical protein WDW86_00865 [Bdellovibrionota bacterium FG-2]